MSGCVITDYNPYHDDYYTPGWHYFLYENKVSNASNNTIKYDISFNIPTKYTKNNPLMFYYFALGGGGNGGDNTITSYVDGYGFTQHVYTDGNGGSSGGWFKRHQNVDVTGSPVTFYLSVGGSSQDTTVKVYGKTWTAYGGNDGTHNYYDMAWGPMKSTTTSDGGDSNGDGAGIAGDGTGSANGAGFIKINGVYTPTLPTCSTVTFADNNNLIICGGDFQDALENNYKTFASFGWGGMGNSLSETTSSPPVNFGGGGLVMIYYHIV